MSEGSSQGQRLLAGIPLDGPQEMHDAYRADEGGKPAFDRVIRGPDALNHHRFDQLCDVLRARAQGALLRAYPRGL